MNGQKFAYSEADFVPISAITSFSHQNNNYENVNGRMQSPTRVQESARG